MSEEVNPFQSPTAPSPAPQTAGSTVASAQAAVWFVSGHTRATWVVALLAIGMLLDLLGAGSGYLEIQLLSRVQSGAPVTPDEADLNDAREALVGLGQMAVYLATSVAFLMWMHRAHRNLPALGAVDLKYSPGWAVGGWFVPVLNLVRPYQVMAEIWRESRLLPQEGSPPYLARGSGSALVGWWWAFFLIMGLAGQLAFRMSLGASDVDRLLAAGWTNLLANLVSLPAALLAITMVRRVDADQDERYASMWRREGMLPATT